MPHAIEELRRAVLALTTTVSSASVRYRLREIHERLAESEETSPAGTSRPATPADKRLN
jgi:hypothetical protein